MARKNVSASEVRAWGRENLSLVPEAGHASLGATARGRLHPEVVSAFRKHNPRLTYEPKVAESKTVKVRVPRTDKAGRTSLRSTEVSYDEAREVAALAGESVGARGRLSADALAQVGAALM